MIVITYGGGTNSTAMIIEMHKRNNKWDAIIFADTGGERPHTYKFIKTFNDWLKSKGYQEIIIVKRTNKFGKIETLEEECLNQNTLPSVVFGFKTCSQKYKIQPVNKFLNNWKPAKEYLKTGEKIIKAIGIDAGESHRAKDFPDKKYTQWYPLVEWGIDREDCIDIIKAEGLPLPGKSSCFFCPNMKQWEILQLHCELKSRAVKMEDQAELTNMKGLGRDWSWKSLIRGDDLQIDMFEKEMPCGCYDG